MSTYSDKLLSFGAELLLPLSELNSAPLVNSGSVPITGTHDAACIDSNASLVPNGSATDYCMDYTSFGANSIGELNTLSTIKSVSFVWFNDGVTTGNIVDLRNPSEVNNNLKFTAHDVTLGAPIIRMYYGSGTNWITINLTAMANNIYPIFVIFDYNNIVDEFKIFQFSTSASAILELGYYTSAAIDPKVKNVIIGDATSGVLTNEIDERLTDGVDYLTQVG